MDFKLEKYIKRELPDDLYFSMQLAKEELTNILSSSNEWTREKIDKVKEWKDRNQEQAKESFVLKYDYFYSLTQESLSLITDKSALEQHREKLAIAIEQLPHNTEERKEKAAELEKQIKAWNWIHQNFDNPYVKADLESILNTLPKEANIALAGRLGLATSNYILEMGISNFVELGLIDGIAATMLLTQDLTNIERNIYVGLLSWSALPLPLPSPAGMTRMLCHIFVSKPRISRYNKLTSETLPEHSRFSPFNLFINSLTSFEYMGLTLLPILNILDAYSLELTLKTYRLLYKLKQLKQFEDSLINQEN